jgi:hypothetical protein
MTKMTITCESFRPWRRNTLFGFCEIMIAELNLHIKDIAIHQKGSSRWAQMPAKPLLKDGVLAKDDSGKAQYVNILEFNSREARDAFSRAVVAAVLEHIPDAFKAESRNEPAATSAASGGRAAFDDEVPFAPEWR